jgi:hypothetical protein
LAQALKAEITPVERQALTAYMDGLTDEQGG